MQNSVINVWINEAQGASVSFYELIDSIQTSYVNIFTNQLKTFDWQNIVFYKLGKMKA